MSPDTIGIAAGSTALSYDPATGAFLVTFKGKEFMRGLCTDNGPAASTPDVRVNAASGKLGFGQCMEVAHASGRTDTLTLYDGVPFLCIRTSIRNTLAVPLELRDVLLPSFTVNVGAPLKDLRTLSCNGLQQPAAGSERVCFSHVAVGHPATRHGVVCGWLTHHRASGIVSAGTENGLVRLAPRAEYGWLALPPGETVEGDLLAVGYFEDVLDGLESYARGIAAIHEIKPARPPSGYCTWYHDYSSNQDDIAKLAEWCGRNLRDFGLEFIQIDDGWQIGGWDKTSHHCLHDFTRHKPDGCYSRGMKPTADAIKAHGLTAGLWLFPCGWDPNAPDLVEHPDWFVRRADGSFLCTRWTGHNLDMTHPDAKRFLHSVIDRISNQWGYKYLKLDGIASPMAADTLDIVTYEQELPPGSGVKRTYREDGFGDARLHEPGRTQIEAHRAGLQVVRDAAGKDAFLLGCTISNNLRTMGASFGLVDAMRVGADTGAKWESLVPGFAVGSHLYFLNGRVWYNDADCLMLRDPLTLDQARAVGTWIAISGAMNVVSEWLPGLPPEKLDILKRTLPNHNLPSRPIDLFETPAPRIWHLRHGTGSDRRDIVAVFNWLTTPDRVSLPMAKLGLPDSASDLYVGFDFWANEFLSPFSGELTLDLRPTACGLVAIRRAADHPVVVSTSRHVTQGATDLFDTHWDGATRVLKGISRVVRGDPYEIRIATPTAANTWQAIAAHVSDQDAAAGVAVAARQDGCGLRILITSPVSREVNWRISF